MKMLRIFRTTPFGVESLVVMPINPQRLLTKTLCLKARVNNNNNNNTTNFSRSARGAADLDDFSAEVEEGWLPVLDVFHLPPLTGDGRLGMEGTSSPSSPLV